MRSQVKVIGVVLTMVAASIVGLAQGGGPALARFLAPPEQVVAIRAGRLFDPKAGTMSNNQVILVKGDRITDVGAGLAIPQGARVIDLSGGSVLPGMMDTHVHLFGANGTSTERVVQAMVRAQAMLGAGFTTLIDMDSRGGFSTVDIRNLINVGTVQGPRLQVVGQALNPRAGTPYSATERNGRFAEPFVEDKNINSPWLARGAVREAALHGQGVHRLQHFLFTSAGLSTVALEPDDSVRLLPSSLSLRTRQLTSAAWLPTAVAWAS